MTSLGQKTTNLLAGAAFSLAALTPQFATQVHADDVKLAAANTTPKVVIEYGSKIVEIEDIEYYMKSLGIPVELKAGYENASCGRVTVNGKSVEFDQHGVDGGKLGAFIQNSAEGNKVHSMPSCNADT